MPTILLLGGRSQLGRDLLAARARFPALDLVATTSAELDVTDEAAVAARLRALRPAVVINCAAYHVVDECERQPARSFAVNATAVGALARACHAQGARLVHFSTDYVFDGAQGAPYVETDRPAPQSVYAASKLAGEHLALAFAEAVQVFRVSGLYGVSGSAGKGTNFPKTMLRLARAGKPIRVVDDQVLTPTATADLADAVLTLCTRDDLRGVFHLTSGGSCSWYEFARELFRVAGLTPDCTPCASSEFPTVARRPAYSVLDNAALRAAGVPDLRPWQEALAGYVRAEARAAPSA